MSNFKHICTAVYHVRMCMYIYMYAFMHECMSVTLYDKTFYHNTRLYFVLFPLKHRRSAVKGRASGKREHLLLQGWCAKRSTFPNPKPSTSLSPCSTGALKFRKTPIEGYIWGLIIPTCVSTFKARKQETGPPAAAMGT